MVQTVEAPVEAADLRHIGVSGVHYSFPPTFEQAFLILRFGYVALPIIAGLDKYFHRLVDWEQYLSPFVARLVPIQPHRFMLLVGAIEIAAGLLVAFRPRLGAYVVAVWLWFIILNLLLIPAFYDIALRDFGLSLGALALAKLSVHISPTNA